VLQQGQPEAPAALAQNVSTIALLAQTAQAFRQVELLVRTLSYGLQAKDAAAQPLQVPGAARGGLGLACPEDGLARAFAQQSEVRFRLRQTPRGHDSQGLAWRLGVVNATGQGRVVPVEGVASHEDGLDAAAELVHFPAGVVAAYPLGVA